MQVEATLPAGSGALSARSAAAARDSAGQPASRTGRRLSRPIGVEVDPRPKFAAGGGSVVEGREDCPSQLPPGGGAEAELTQAAAMQWGYGTGGGLSSRVCMATSITWRHTMPVTSVARAGCSCARHAPLEKFHTCSNMSQAP